MSTAHAHQDNDEAVELYNAKAVSPILLLCDHASSHIPTRFGNLGLGERDLARHVAWDIGAADVTRALSGILEARAILTRFCRLLIDPNRGLDDPTLVMRLYDMGIVEGNRYISNEEIKARIVGFYMPYENAVKNAIAQSLRRDEIPLIFSIHSFTPDFKGRSRPWHIGILWNGFDGRLALPLLTRLKARKNLSIGDNQPYSGALPGDTLDRHAAASGVPHVLIEIRQDLIDDPRKAEAWAKLLGEEISALAAELSPMALRHFSRPA